MTRIHIAEVKLDEVMQVEYFKRYKGIEDVEVGQNGAKLVAIGFQEPNA